MIRYFEELDSTNTKIKELANDGAPHGTVVVADRQTAGKGRRGRTWESPAGTNLYFSILLRPQIETWKAPMLTLVMAYSAAKVIRNQLEMQVMIKWPNDLVVSKKKICGILTEMSLKKTEIDYIVVGTGINVNITEFPEELQDKATSLFLEKGELIERKGLLEKILEEFWIQYDRFLKVHDLSYLQEEYNEMLINRNREVVVLEPGNEYPAIAKGINQTGELIVALEDGSESVIYAGEVSVRGIYGYV